MMKKRYYLTLTLLVLLSLIVVPRAVLSAGGRIEGKVTDPKGAAIVGAKITVTDQALNQSFPAVSDSQGNYKVEGLAAGIYSVAISARGFAMGRVENVKVDGGAVVPVNLKLEVAELEAEVNVPAGGVKPNSDPIYQQLRQQSKNEQSFAGNYAAVNNLVLKRDAAVFTMKSGEVYFLAPTEGRVTGAVFIGDGQMTLVPPTDTEKRSLQLFTDEPSITEDFSRLVIRFTDKTFDEIKNSPNAKMSSTGSQASRARDAYRENEQLLRQRLRDNRDLRTLVDLYCADCDGYFGAFIDGRKHNKLVFLMDSFGVPSVSPEEVLLLSYGESDGGFWTAFHLADEYKQGGPTSAEDHRLVDLTHHEIETTIKGAHLTASDLITFESRRSSIRVLPLDLFPTLRVSRIEDEKGRDLKFIQENKDEDADFAVIFPESLEAGKTYKIKVHYAGSDALLDSGGGNFILNPSARANWYPNNAGTQFGDRALFEMTFRFPKALSLVSTGALASPEVREGDTTVAKWTSGATQLAVAGFNYGRFKKKELADKDTGLNIEFYANTEVPDELKRVQMAIEQAEARGARTTTTLGSISTSGMADQAISDALNSTRIYSNFFGKLPYSRIAMTQQPAGNFGQAWPTLIFMPYTAFMDSTQRVQLMGIRSGTDSFFRYVAPHEVAHQWWGHVIGWNSYRDQWMSEGFAEFSSSLYVQLTRGNDKFVDFWENQRKLITESSPATRDRKPYTVGPVTQGYRLNSGKTGAVAQRMIYPKGAYILHMIRMLLYDATTGDDRFKFMMRDFVKTHFNKDISTEDLKAAVEKHMTDEMDFNGNHRMDWFFDEWVYGTEMPSYRFDYQIGADGSLSGRITQSGVSDKFVMRVPLYVDYGKGWVRLGSAALAGNSTVDIGNIKLPKGLKRAAICAWNDVLALSIQNNK
jgi:hypothetical protein